MRIAFTGKGGSGKSTVATLFIEHLRSQAQRVLAVDADINVHLASLLGAELNPDAALSKPENVATIRRHLLGDNTLVAGIEQFVKTTPPGPGSRMITLAPADPVVAGHAVSAGPDVSLMHVGTYESADIGTSCYHVSLSILENMLSHFELGGDDWVVCDMVAGTDAFSNSLHAQFDAIAVIVEPTPESVSVAKKFRELAGAAGTLDTLVLIGNKTDDPADRAYLESEIGMAPHACLATMPGLRHSRQRGDRPALSDIDDTSALAEIARFARSSPMTAQRRQAHLRDLHLRFAQQDWVRTKYGDITTQLPRVDA